MKAFRVIHIINFKQAIKLSSKRKALIGPIKIAFQQNKMTLFFTL